MPCVSQEAPHALGRELPAPRPFPGNHFGLRNSKKNVHIARVYLLCVSVYVRLVMFHLPQFYGDGQAENLGGAVSPQGPVHPQWQAPYHPAISVLSHAVTYRPAPHPSSLKRLSVSSAGAQ